MKNTEQEKVEEKTTEQEASTEETSSEEIKSSKEEAESTETETHDSSSLVDGMWPKFKKTMDSYEAFYDEYCDFMKKYAGNSFNLKLLEEYTDMVSKIAEMDERFSVWNEDEMNGVELKYYLEVNNRVE